MINRLASTSRAIWSSYALGLQGATSSRSPRLTQMVDRFEAALEGIPIDLARPVRARLRRARTSLDFWHIRSEVFDLASRSFGPLEAEARVNTLNELFESTHGKSGPKSL